MEKLIDGIHRFQSGVFAPHRGLYEGLVAGQSPSVLFITCSDSRISPSTLTQSEPGELFILRNAGNLVPSWGIHNGAEAAAIEYAVDVLEVRDIIICGHTQCGAMTALLGPPDDLAELPAVANWLKHAEATRRVMRTQYKDVSSKEARLETCIEENVLAQIESLRTHPAVFAALTRGAVSLHAWVYSLETGGVAAFDSEAGQFAPFVDAKREPAKPLTSAKLRSI